MRKEFVIDKITYVVAYSNSHEFIFYVDYERSPLWLTHQQPGFGWTFGEEPMRRSYDRIPTQHVFQIKRIVCRFVDETVDGFKPYYFMFGTHDSRKYRIYARFAEHLARRHGYYLKPIKSRFVFTRQVHPPA